MALDTSQALATPVQAHQLDQVRLKHYLRDSIPGLNESTSIRVLQFSYGQSNPTYVIEAIGLKYVLRKKPPGQVLASAHAIEREYRVLSALQNTPVPVPSTICLCTDESVIGTPFYLMRHLQGVVYTDNALPALPPQKRAALYGGMASTLATLHSVRPADVGLQCYGRMSGYCSRQVWRWSQQYHAQLSGPAMPEMIKLHKWLQANIPAADADESQTRISHGDFKMDNLVFDSSQPGRVLGVLDWELSTLGHPLADLAYSAMPYHLQKGSMPAAAYTLPEPRPRGIPSEAEYVAVYCQARGIAAPSPHDWSFFVALGLFRLAAISAGVGARAKLGNASSSRAAQVGSPEVVRGLASAALLCIESTLGSEAFSASDSHSSDSSPSIISRITSGQSAGTSSSRSSTQHAAGFDPSPRVEALLKRLKAFMAEHVVAADRQLEERAMSPQRWTVHPLMEELKVKAQQQGLWNLFIPVDMAACFKYLIPANPQGLDALLSGPGFSNLEYAFLSEQMGRYPWASEVFNCSAPDTGNMEVLARYGAPEQQRQWLLPLLRGQIRSCFAMTEPAVASSDATNIQSRIQREGDHWVLNGHKWWASGAPDPRCGIGIFMGKSSLSAAQHKQQSMILVPMQSPGVKVIRPLTVYGYDDAPHGHAEVKFENVRVPADSIILGEGRGFEIAQGRLGPGRLHHCMRCIGMGQQAIELMAVRAQQRVAFGRPIAQHGAFLERLGQARIDLDAARLVVLDAAHTLDCVGNKLARKKIAQAKVAAPNAVLRIIDEAVQAHGGAGVSQDTVLARLWAGARTLRLADGPDAVHLASIGKLELAGFRSEQAESRL